MFAKPVLKIDLPAINKQNALIVQSPKLMATAMKRNIKRLETRWEQALGVEPPDAANFYSLKYKSRKQLRKVHALRNERGGGPYQRTHRLSKSWDVDVKADASGGVVAVTNTAPQAGLVYGTDEDPRQPMFNPLLGGVPWLDPNDVNAQFAVEGVEVIEQTWFTIADSRAGVR